MMKCQLNLKNIKKIDYDNKYIIIDSGSPHLVNIVENVDNINM